MLVQSIKGCLASQIGEAGLSQDALEARLVRLEPALDGLRRDYEAGALPLLQVPDRQDDIVEAEAALSTLMDNAKTLVFFGTGGSSLGGQMLAQLGGWFIPGEQPSGQNKRPRTRFYDNLDARTLERTLAGLDLERTRFVVISKSGTTPETMVQFLAALQAVEAAGFGDRAGELFLTLTEPAHPGRTNGLREVSEARGIPVLDHDPGIGGRFSALTNVGLLAALARGLDVRAIRQGAKGVIDQLMSVGSASDFAPAIGAAVTIGLVQERGVSGVVMMPYTDRLERFGRWFVQLWAESLGKNGQGTSAIAALGPVDQHSQLQLYLDGPKQHLVTVLRHASEGTGPVIDAALAREAGLPQIAGRAAGDLVAAQQRAIPEALAAAGRAVRVFDLSTLDEQVLGNLMMHFMIETILAARLLEIDPFDQPAVEQGKILTRKYLEHQT